MIAKAEEVTLKMAGSRQEQGQWSRSIVRGLQMARLDEDQWGDVLRGNLLPTMGESEVFISVKAGMLTEARELFESLEPVETWEELGRAKRRGAKGVLALAGGDPATAIPLLQEAVDGWRNHYLGGGFFGACEMLARAQVTSGRVETAFAVLEDASQQRPRAVYGKGGWIEMRFYTAELYREYGREAAAEEVEAELRSLLRLADPDTRWARRLERLGQSTTKKSTPK
jgi:hypothetical protein